VTEIFASDWFAWGVGLILVFQLLVILLGEAIYRADRRTLPIGGIFRALRNIVLPFAVLFVFLTRLLELDRNSVTVRLVETALWVSVVYAVLLIFNVLVFENAAKESWRICRRDLSRACRMSCARRSRRSDSISRRCNSVAPPRKSSSVGLLVI